MSAVESPGAQATDALPTIQLTGRVAVVTAAGSGMGRAIARALGDAGAHTVAVDIDGNAAAETADIVARQGGSADSYAVDVADVDALRTMFEDVERSQGRLDILVNHAGIPGAGGMDLSLEQWQTAIDVNMRSAFFATTFALPALCRSGHGAIVYTASTSALVSSSSSPLYALTKGGLLSLMRSVAVLHAKDNVRANAICPSTVETPMLPQFLSRMSSEGVEQRKAAMLASIPLGRAARPEEIAGAVLFLCSDLASFVTGVVLPVDGGFTAR